MNTGARIDSLKSRFAKLSVAYDAAKAVLEEDKQELTRLKTEVDSAQTVLDLLQQVAQTVQQSAHEGIANIVTRCLQAVFTDPYSFRIHFERKRGKTEAKMVFYRGENALDARYGVAGGVLDVAAFALRVACLLLTRPPLRRVLILDEPFKNLNGDEERRRARELIETLPRELGIQIIFSTGYTWLQTGKIIEVRKKRETSG